MRKSQQSYGPLPELASLADLIATYHARGRASTALRMGDWTVQLTLARIRTAFINDDTGQTILRAMLIKGAGGLSRPWMYGMAARLGMRDCAEPEHEASMWHIRGVMAQQQEGVA